MQRLLVILVVFSAVSFAAFPPFVSEQGVNSNSQAEVDAKKAAESDLGTKKTALLNISSDLEEMMKSLQGSEIETALSIDQRATYGIMYLDAAGWFLAL